jgi:hypothetical protein
MGYGKNFGGNVMNKYSLISFITLVFMSLVIISLLGAPPGFVTALKVTIPMGLYGLTEWFCGRYEK